MFWRKKTNEAAVSGSRLAVPAAEPTNTEFECVFCQGDVRSETVLAVRRITSFFAMWRAGADGKPETLPLDDAKHDLWTGRYICTACALNRDIPGLDKEKLRSLLAGLQSAKSSATH
jgi:hypothetical protein